MTLSYDTYYDKVLGGWIGKCAGGILGAPIEGIKAFNAIELSPALFKTNYPNDDLDLQILWLDMVLRKGSSLAPEDFAQHWIRHVDFPWNEYGIARRNLMLGILPPQSGRENNYYWHQSMGCPIRSEIWGMLCAGCPEKAIHFAGMDGSIDHHGFSVEAEQFLSACAANAFMETDMETLLQKTIALFPEESSIHQLYTRVKQWCEKSGYAASKEKIKSYYGDADFTSAPMNIAFTLLVLLHKGNSFDCVLDALHLGHDSDCIVATAGALIGLMKGAGALPVEWKKMVGNTIVISDEIKGIYKPKTLEQLTEATCIAGIAFFQDFNQTEKTTELPTTKLPLPQKTNLALEVQPALKHGTLSYGRWLMAGPFIRDDKTIFPSHATYREHGVATMPSVQYMNHDRVNVEEDFLSWEDVQALKDRSTWDNAPFNISLVTPKDFRIPVMEHYQGRGERTVYLYSELHLDEPQTLWVCIGSTAYFTLWINKEKQHRQRQIRRSWIGDNTIAYHFQKGVNALLLKVDQVTDDNVLEFALKEHHNKHPHQTHYTLFMPTIEL